MASVPARVGDGHDTGRVARAGFSLLSNAFLDELRARVSLSGLIGRTLKLQKAGGEFKAPCPFHNEKTPSFYVNDGKQFYHCFGCGAHGDAIRWMTDQLGMPFIDAVRELAQSAGLEMPTADPVTQERAKRAAGLQDVTAAAATWFTERLFSFIGQSARDYLEGRGIVASTIMEFGLGYAPNGRRQLAQALKSFPTETLIEAGMLIRPEEGEAYDRFRERLMIPICDGRGRVIAFGGRALGGVEPKYLNSPETPLFDKGATLWNLHRAAAASRRSARLIIVEGYLDAISLHQAGIREVVAPLGTALTERQLEKAWSLIDTPLLCLDGDAAGQKAALRAAARAMPLLRPGKSLSFATLPAGMDPDDLIRFGGAQEFEKAIANPRSLLRLLYEHERANGDMALPEQRAGLKARLDTLAGTCNDQIVAREYRRSFSDLFYEDFGWRRDARRLIRSDLVKTAPRKPGDVGSSIVRSLLYGLNRFPVVLREYAEHLVHIRIDNPNLSRNRDTLVHSVMRGDVLHGSSQEAVTTSDGLPEAANDRLQMDLRFAFTRSDVPEDRQIAVLAGLTRFLCEERELDEGLSGLDRAAVEAVTNDTYLAIEAERQYLRSQKGSLFDWAYELGTHE